MKFSIKIGKMALLCLIFPSLLFAQNIWDQPLYKKYIGSKMAEKYRTPSENAPGQPSNFISSTASGYGWRPLLTHLKGQLYKGTRIIRQLSL